MGGRYRLFFLLLLILMTTCVSKTLTPDLQEWSQEKNTALEVRRNTTEIVPNQESMLWSGRKILRHIHVDFEETVWREYIIIRYLDACRESSKMAEFILIRSLYGEKPLQEGHLKFPGDDLRVEFFCFFAFLIYFAITTLRQLMFTNADEEDQGNFDDVLKMSGVTILEDIALSMKGVFNVDVNLLHRSRLLDITPSDLAEVLKAPAVPKWKERKTDEWMSDPHGWRQNFTKCLISPAFELLASFKELYGMVFPNNVSFVLLAEAGFKLLGDGKVECENCKNKVNIERFTSSPTDAQYHSKDCSKINGCGNSELDEGIGHDSEDIETDSVMPICESNTVEELAGKWEDENSTIKDPQSHESMKDTPGALASLDTKHDTLTDGKLLKPPDISGSNEGMLQAGEMYLDTGRTSDANRRRHDSTSTSSSGYSSASAISTDSTLSTKSNASVNLSPETNVSDEGFFDETAFETETHGDFLSHDQIPPTLTIPCEKNKGHYAYFPITQLELKYIPSCVRYPNVLEFLKLAAMLTVRVIVNVTSSKRPEKDPAKKSKNRLGTGSCFERQAETVDKHTDGEQPGKWNPVKMLFSGKKHKPGRIYVETTRHVIFDEFEAQNTEVEFFYDHPNRKDVKRVKGLTIEHSGRLGDYKSILVCKTSDLGLVEFVNQTRKKMMELFRNFTPDIKHGLLRRMFIIGHPHGGEKVLSYGDSVMIKYNLISREENGRTVCGMEKISGHQQVTAFGDRARKVLLYTADTCRGSSGSPILTFKTKNADDTNGANAGGDVEIDLDLWMHNGIDSTHGLGGSIMKELTAEDIANHGRPTGTRSFAQDNMSRNNGGDGQSSFTEVAPCPVFTVVGHPSYPAYVAYQSRLDSYNEWNYHHIHLPRNLAEAGFFYAGYADCVRCFQCGIGLRTWKEGDDIYVEHYKNRPNCQFLQMQLRVRGITDPETQLRPQPREGSGSEENGPRANGMPKITMVVQQTPSTSSNRTETQSHNLMESEKSFMSQAKEIERGLSSIPARQVATVGFVTDSPAGAGSSSGSQTQYNPSAASGSGAANGEKDLTYTLLERENQFLTKQLTCKVCFRKPIKDLFLPCGELYACTDCSKLLTHCPSCKKQILATVTTYFT